MPTLSSSNLSQLNAKLEGVYPNNFGAPPAGNGFKLNMLSESLGFDQKTVSSKTIRSDRQVPDIVPVSASANGGFQFELQYQEYDAFIEAVMQSTYTVYGTNGQSTTIASLTPAANSFTAGAAPTGGSAFTTLKKGQWFTVIPDAGATQAVKDYLKGRAFMVSRTVAPTATAITTDPSTPVNTTILSGALTNARIATSRLEHANTMRSFALEVQHTDINVARQYVGMIPSKMDLKLSVGEIISGGFEFVGKNMNALATLPGGSIMGTPAASKTFTPANAVRGIFDIFEGGASISATTYIKSGELSIDNSLRAQEAVGVFGLAGIGAGTMMVMGKLEVYFASSALYNKFINNEASSLSIPILDVDGNGYVFHFPRIKYTAAKVNVGGLDQDNTLMMDFQALPDPDATADTFGKTVVISRVGAVTT